MKQENNLVNVAPTSENRHYVKNAKQVIVLDAINETFLVEGESELVTNNHTTLNMKEDCLITCQNVYDPFAKAFVKSKD